MNTTTPRAGIRISWPAGGFGHRAAFTASSIWLGEVVDGLSNTILMKAGMPPLEISLSSK